MPDHISISHNEKRYSYNFSSISSGLLEISQGAPLQLNDSTFTSFLKSSDDKIHQNIASMIKKTTPKDSSKEDLQKIYSCLDLTSLNSTDSEQEIEKLCHKAFGGNINANMTASNFDSSPYRPAAVCVFPSFIESCLKHLKDTDIKIATVAGGFPHGQIDLNCKINEVQRATELGAQEIDVVINRGRFLSGDFSHTFEEIFEMKRAAGTAKLKVILETGELGSLSLIRLASEIALDAGADFLKTSTGKSSVSASLEAVAVMAQAIAKHPLGTQKGIKPAGGISDAKTAAQYYNLVEEILGPIDKDRFRIGASRLADDILNELNRGF